MRAALNGSGRHRADMNAFGSNTGSEHNLPLIQVDPEQIKEALMNVLINAREAMPEGGTLTLTTRRAGRSDVDMKWLIRGSGIAPDHLSRIFEPFFTTKDYGTGLGLTNVKRLVEDNGGTLRVNSSQEREHPAPCAFAPCGGRTASNVVDSLAFNGVKDRRARPFPTTGRRLKRPSSKAAANEGPRRTPAVRRGTERSENAAGGLFQHPVRRVWSCGRIVPATASRSRRDVCSRIVFCTASIRAEKLGCVLNRARSSPLRSRNRVSKPT